jgi:uncharacterized protein
MSKRVRLLCHGPDAVRECLLQLPEAATIAEVLEAARPLLGEQAADWQGAPTGIYGCLYPRHHVPSEGDRVELYRPLLIDPRDSRRSRAARAARPRGSSGN